MSSLIRSNCYKLQWMKKKSFLEICKAYRRLSTKTLQISRKRSKKLINWELILRIKIQWSSKINKKSKKLKLKKQILRLISKINRIYWIKWRIRKRRWVSKLPNSKKLISKIRQTSSLSPMQIPCRRKSLKSLRWLIRIRTLKSMESRPTSKDWNPLTRISKRSSKKLLTLKINSKKASMKRLTTLTESIQKEILDLFCGLFQPNFYKKMTCSMVETQINQMNL